MKNRTIKIVKDEDLQQISGGDHQLLPYRDQLSPHRSELPGGKGNELKEGRDLGQD